MRLSSRPAALRLIALLLAPLAAAAAPSPLAEVVLLPEFKVFDDRPLPAPEKWDYVKIGNFEILSNASKRVTKQFVKDLSEFQIVLGIVAPTMRIKSELPVTVVLCAKGNQFARFVSKPTIRSIRGIAASLVRDQEIASIVIDYESLSVPEPMPFFGFNAPGLQAGNRAVEWSSTREIHASEQFIRQYIHLSLSQLTPRPPAWIAEGLANIYSNIDYNNKWIEIGLPKGFGNDYDVSVSPTSPTTSFQSFDSSSSYGGDPFSSSTFSNLASSSTYTYRVPFALMSMEKMFAVNFDSPLLTGSPSGDNYRLSGWSSQATAFVHLCLYGENGKYRPGFLKFASHAASTPPTEAFFKECFGVSFKEMGLIIRSYTEFTNYVGKVYKVTSGGILNPPDPFEIRAATDAEIGRIKGETYRLSGLDEDARREFVVAYLRGERDPQLLASLGLMARQRHDTPRAQTYLEAVAATTPAVPRPRAYLELARVRAEQLAAKSAARPLNVDQTSHLLTPLFTAQRLPQQLVPIYIEIASVWERSSVPPSRENLAALEYGVRLFPHHGELLLRTATLLLKHGYKADAAVHIQRALVSTRDPELKAKFELLRQNIDGPPVSQVTPPWRRHRDRTHPLEPGRLFGARSLFAVTAPAVHPSPLAQA